MVLAAGFGTRLWPLTLDRAKPAVPFLGKPLVTSCVEQLFEHGADRVVVNTHHKPESIRRALSDFGSRVRFSHEDLILGTAGGLAHALANGHLNPDLPTLIVNGKLFLDLDFSKILQGHVRSGAKVTMVLRTNKEREEFREVLFEKNRVIGFEAGRTPKSARPLLFTGVHVIEPSVLKKIPHRFCDTVSDVYPELIEQKEVHGMIVDDGRWWEFSTLERYLDLHERAHREGLGEEVVSSPGAFIEPSAKVHRSVLWEGARVGGGAELSSVILGANVQIPSGFSLSSAAVVRRELASEIERGTVQGDLLIVPLNPKHPS